MPAFSFVTVSSDPSQLIAFWTVKFDDASCPARVHYASKVGNVC